MRKDRTAALEADVRALISSAGVPTEDIAPTEEEVRRTDEAARTALERILASPRDPASIHPAGLPGRFERPGPRARVGAMVRRPAALVLGPLATALTVLVVLLLIAQPWDHESAPITGPTEGPSSAPSSEAPASPDWSTPPLPEFSLVSYEDDPTLRGVAADDALEDLASRAAAQPARGSGPVQEVVLDGWFLTQRQPDAPQPGSDLLPTIARRYFLPDGQFRSIETRGAPLDVHGQVEDPTAGPQPTADETFPGPEEGPDYPASLPTDPARLIDTLVPEPAECPVLAACLSTQLVNLHYMWVLPPDVVAALWRTLAGQPEVTYLGTTVDRLDRPAVGFSVPVAGGKRTTILYADPETGALLGNEDVLLQGGKDFGVTPPAVLAFTALVESRRIPFADLP